MTHNEMIIAAAQSMGWADIKLYHPPSEIDYRTGSIHQPEPFLRGLKTLDGFWMQPPRYDESLDLVAELEHSLCSEDDQRSYYRYLREVVFSKVPNAKEFHALTALAPERLEAYLKTKGLWKP